MQTIEQLQSGKLKGVTSIKLSCNLTEFPEELFQLADTLEFLDLSGNKLSSLPPDFKKFKKLKIAFFSDNLFTELPEVLAECPLLEMIGFKANAISIVSEKAISKNIRWLILTNNKITQLPQSIGYCTRLQKVALAGNLISELPATMANCQNIELLRVSANQLQEIPTWLWKLPKLRWLAYADNPCSLHAVSKTNISPISWADITLNKQLGEGASGHIYKAQFNRGNEKTVAVKIFKGDVTSDGLSQSEMNACLSAGNHPNLVTLVGELAHHPEQKKGLVLALIPESFYNLGLPPSYSTCTRDTFLPSTTFTTQAINSITQQIASVMAHLHNLGIMHGDLYAHNIMIDARNKALLGDFGAATLYDANSKNALAHQLLDVRAFGCLIDDLLQQAIEPTNDTLLQNKLQLISQDCMRCSNDKPITFNQLIQKLNL